MTGVGVAVAVVVALTVPVGVGFVVETGRLIGTKAVLVGFGTVFVTMVVVEILINKYQYAPIPIMRIIATAISIFMILFIKV
jgi:hypothetical protein